MDLVEIRKKAKGMKQEQGQAAPSAKVVPEAKVETAVAPPASDRAARVAEAAPVEGAGLEALDALFRLAPDMALATEENYLQGLEERGKGTDESFQQWLSFGLGAEHYAIDISFVREIIKPREITDIPRVPAFILGIISLRGLIVPVYDLRCRLNLGQGSAAGERARIIVCEQGDRVAGLLVDQITQVVRFSQRDIELPPATLSGVDRDLVEGVGRIDKKMLILLDLASVLNAELM